MDVNINKEFHADEYLNQQDQSITVSVGNEATFQQLCTDIDNHFNKENESIKEMSTEELERLKKAIIGHEKEVNFYKSKIKDYLRQNNLGGSWFPDCYTNIIDAIFHENWGIACIAPWAYDQRPEYIESSSAKIIGDNVYFLLNGTSVLQQRKIPVRRRKQLLKALLMATPKERKEDGWHEVYMLNGIRITMYSGERTKSDQDVIVFRKYVLKELTFEKLTELNTIPTSSIPLFKSMVRAGFNVIFTGAVRSGKSTFLTVWQRNEDPTLEGVAIATDPEIHWEKIMPGAPIMQLVADGADLERITKSLMRGDNGYIILEEARDAVAFNIALDSVTTGTRNSKMTMHVSRASDAPYRMASKIKERYGGNQKAIITSIFQNFNFIFEFMEIAQDRSQKKLVGISELRYDQIIDKVSIHRICQYNYELKVWQWKCDLGEDKKEAVIKIDIDEWYNLINILKDLEDKNPLTGNTVIYPAYYA